MAKIKLCLVFMLLYYIVNAQAQDIYEAIINNNFGALKSIIEKDPNVVNAKNPNGWTPLYQACQNQVHIEILKYLIEKGADVNASDNFGFTPLNSLVVLGHEEGVTLLLANKASVNQKSRNNAIPLHFACLNGNFKIAKLLLDHGADVTVCNSSGDTPLNLASHGGSKEIIDLLLDNGAQYDGSGVKPLLMLQESSRNGIPRLAKLIVKNEGATLFNDPVKNQWTLQDAAYGGSVEILKLLIDNNVTINKGRDIYGWSLIHYACVKGNLEMIQYLVQSGVDINLRTNSGESAFNLAGKNMHPEVQNLIQKLGGANNPIKFPKLKGLYLGQKEPGIIPEIFAPGIISRPDFKELSITFPSDGSEVFYYGYTTEKNQILHSQTIENRWCYPTEFDKSFEFSASEPFITFDGTKLFFSWRNPQYSFYGLWVSEKVNDQWTTPKYSGTGHYLTQTRNGDVYITEVIENSWRSCISKIIFDGITISKLEKVVFPGAEQVRAHPCIAPDGSYLIYDNGGGEHLKLSFRQKDGSWGSEIDLTQNGFERLAGIPTISPDGKYLFFKSGCRGELDIAHGATNRDIYWVSTKIIEELRSME